MVEQLSKNFPETQGDRPDHSCRSKTCSALQVHLLFWKNPRVFFPGIGLDAEKELVGTAYSSCYSFVISLEWVGHTRAVRH